MSFNDALAARNISDGDLANIAGVTLEAVRLWRRGKRYPSVNKIQLIADATGIPPHEIRPDVFSAPAAKGGSK